MSTNRTEAQRLARHLARQRLLTPLTDEEAKGLRLITKEELEAALREADAIVRDMERAAQGKSPSALEVPVSASSTILAYFTGVWPGESNGHFCYRRSGERARCSKHTPASPWGWPRWHSPVDESLVLQAAWPGGYTDTQSQPEGSARVVRQDGWTLVSMWDRSADKRLNSHASFALHADLEPEEALARARILFPAVFARIETHLGRPVLLDRDRHPLRRVP